jgi:hypothetical protein
MCLQWEAMTNATNFSAGVSPRACRTKFDAATLTGRASRSGQARRRGRCGKCRIFSHTECAELARLKSMSGQSFSSPMWLRATVSRRRRLEYRRAAEQIDLVLLFVVLRKRPCTNPLTALAGRSKAGHGPLQLYSTHHTFGRVSHAAGRVELCLLWLLSET